MGDAADDAEAYAEQAAEEIWALAIREARTAKQKEMARKRRDNGRARLKKRKARVREDARRKARKERRAKKAAPRQALSAWAREVVSCGACAVCGVGVHRKLDKKGRPKLNKKGMPILVPLHAHHLLPKERYPELRCEPMNGICLCPLHHKFDKYSAHRNPIWFVLWLRRHRYQQYLWCKARIGDPLLRSEYIPEDSSVKGKHGKITT